jgi:Icc-related predicted phosphoesterase
MKILYTSDIHADPNHLFSMLKIAEVEMVEGLIIGGDLVPHHLPDEFKAGVVMSQAAYLKHTLIPAVADFIQRRNVAVYLDLANDDFICNRSILKEKDGKLFYLLHMQKWMLTEGIDIIGYMTVPPTPFSRKDWEKPDSREKPYAFGNQVLLSGYRSTDGRLEETVIDLASKDTIERELEALSGMIENPFVFVSHCPPNQTSLDMLYNDRHVGSGSIRRFIAEWSEKGKLIASFHGHIHESPSRSGSIVSYINNTPCFNPGQSSGSNAPFRYVLFELSNDPGRVEIVVLETPDT